MSGRRRSILCLLCFASAAAGGLPAEDDLYYVVEDGRLVFTNTPTATARPLPGAPPPTAQHTVSHLPGTIYDPFIERVARENGISPGLIKAVALVESGFDPDAVSPKGAGGLMQLMPGTARQYGVSDVFDPLENLRGGASHLRRLLDEFDGDLTLALAAYNAGSGAVRNHGGVPDYRETREYLRRVKARLGPGAPIRAERGNDRAPARYEDVELLRQADGSVLLRN